MTGMSATVSVKSLLPSKKQPGQESRGLPYNASMLFLDNLILSALYWVADLVRFVLGLKV